MKKLLLSIGLCFATLITNAQVFNQFDVLNVRALNIGTNGFWVTNLSCLVTNYGMTYNPSNVMYTNLNGSYIGTATNYLASIGTTNSNTQFPVFKDIPLWTDRNGNPINFSTMTANAGTSGNSNLTYFSQQTLFVEYLNPLGSNAAWGITFRPVWDGVTPQTTTADDWGFGVAALATTKAAFATNIPVWRWPGAKALRVFAVTNNSLLGGIQFQTNSTFITKLKVVGFVP